MARISFPREGYGGSQITRERLEKIYFRALETRIKKRLQKVFDDSAGVKEKCAARYFKNNLRKILLSQPEELVKIRHYVLNRYLGLFDARDDKSFNKRILKAFDYDGYRNGLLVALAKRLDIKTCPYCNAHYTLFLDVKGLKDHPEGLAKFQFDHFLNKGDAPFLSMSLYNLIPSCAVCNSSKSNKDWPLQLNPYVSDINSLFEFRVYKPLRLWTGAKPRGLIKIQMKPTRPENTEAVSTLDKEVYLSQRYGRHWDVAQDVFERAYTYPYYSDKNNFRNMLTPLDEEKLKKIWMGNYTKKSEIELQPLTKFRQDLWKQANRELGRKMW